MTDRLYRTSGSQTAVLPRRYADLLVTNAAFITGLALLVHLSPDLAELFPNYSTTKLALRLQPTRSLEMAVLHGSFLGAFTALSHAIPPQWIFRLLRPDLLVTVFLEIWRGRCS